MVVNGNMKVKVEVTPSEAIKVIEDYFGVYSDHVDKEAEIIEKNGNKYLYMVESGLYENQYNYITGEPQKIAIFEALQLIKTTIKKGEKLK